MSESRTPFSYQGSKLKELNRIKSVIGTGKNILEPFFGSGIITGEIGAYGGCIGNDLNRDIYDIWKFSMENNQEFFKKITEYCDEENRYQDYYYGKREEYNVYWRNEEYNVERTALYFFLLNSCHGAMVRYGPNGFNTSYKLFLSKGRKYNVMSKILKLKDYSSKLKEMYNEDTLDLLKRKHDNIDLIYCDPPYVNSISDYEGGWSEDDYLEMLEILKYQKNKNDINSLVSNYSKEGFDDKFDDVIHFNSYRMAGTDVVRRDDILGIIGSFNNTIERFFH